MKTPALSRLSAAMLMIISAAGGIGSTTAQTAATAPPANPSTKFLLISFEERFGAGTTQTGGTLEGRATLAGAANDRAVRHEQFTVTGVNKDGTQVTIAGTSQIVGTKGTLLTSFTGTIYFSSDPAIAYVEGIEDVTGGTGIYTGARGRGTFEATQDFAGQPSQIVGVVELRLKFGQ